MTDKNILSEIDETVKKTENILSVTRDKEYKEKIKQLFMCKKLRILKNKMSDEEYIIQLFNTSENSIPKDKIYTDFPSCFLNVIDDFISSHFNPIIYVPRDYIKQFSLTCRDNDINPNSFNNRSMEYNYYGIQVPVKYLDIQYRENCINLDDSRLIFINRDKDNNIIKDEYMIFLAR